MTELVIRALSESDAHLFHSLSDPELVGRGRFGHPYGTRGQGGEYRPDWTWVALRDEKVVARAAWWSGPEDTSPIALDWFDFAEGEAEAASELLRVSPLRTEYALLAPPGWLDRPLEVAAVQGRIDAAKAAGYRVLVERYRYEWTPEAGLPGRTGRLEYRPEPDDAVVLEVLGRIVEGSLDAHDRRTAAEQGTEAAARQLLDFFHWCPSPREWLRLAWTPGGELAGMQVPAHNPAGPCVGYIGVVPEQRGHGYAYDLLVECTNDLVDRGAKRIAAATDQGNFPMAAHFATAGYPISQERIDLVPSAES